jgi:hypothetical protein
MKVSQLTQGDKRRVMYVENKDGLIDGERARVGWVEFSKTGRTIRYRGRSFSAIGGRGIAGNFIDLETGEEYWISGIKKRDSNQLPGTSVRPVVDDDASAEYERLRTDV